MSRFEEYIEHFQSTNGVPNTVRQVVRHVTDFGDWLGFRHLDLAALQDFRKHVSETVTSPGYRNVILGYVKACLKWLRMRGELDIEMDYVQDALKRFPVDRPLPDVFTRGQIRKLVVAAGEWDGEHRVGGIVLAALLTGARRAELETMTSKAINIETDSVVIKSTKTRREREFPLELMGAGRVLFERILSRKGAVKFHFENRAWAAMRKLAGVSGVPFKTTRNTVSSFLKSGEVNAWAVDQMLGHSAAVAAQSYDRHILHVKGDNLPVMYGCATEFRKACKSVRL